jgi:Ca2+-binding RTX toxin-like protein
VQGDAQEYDLFLEAHGDDEGGVETAFHLLQGNGGTLMFQGRDFIDTVVDAIYHYGFDIVDGVFENEDGNQNEDAADVAGWLNYFVNGVNVVFGDDSHEVLHSGTYSAVLADAANETFLAEGGNDEIWADVGNDTVWAGKGNDVSGGGEGKDSLNGENGADTLWGDEGADILSGDGGADELGAGQGNDVAKGGDGTDTLYGEDGNDKLYGDAGSDLLYSGDGNDVLFGGSENDSLSGEDGNDNLNGDAGQDEINGGDDNDTLSGGDGADILKAGDGTDRVFGGAGADDIYLWEDKECRDTLVFKSGDSGKTTSTIDQVEGFESGTDKIDLRSFAGMQFETLDYAGGGTASVYFDGKMLRIDSNGDAVTDMIVEFTHQETLVASDFLFA